MKIDNALKKRLKDAVVAKLRDEQESTVVVETPYPISDREVASLKTQFPSLGEKLLVNKVIPDLLGGFVIKFNSKVIDASIRSEIDSIVDELALA